MSSKPTGPLSTFPGVNRSSPSPPSSSQDLPVWAIVLIVICAICAIALGGYTAYKGGAF